MKRKYRLAVLVLMVLAMIFSVGCSEEDIAALVNTNDTTAPVVTLLAPVHGSTVNADFNLMVNVVDNENYSTAVVTLNDVVVPMDTTLGDSTSTSSDPIDYSALPVGERQNILVVASNNNGLVSTNQFYFYTSATTNTNVVVDTTDPTVSIVSPTDGSTVGDTFAVSVNASDAETYVAYVEISIDGTLFETITNKPSGSYITGNYDASAWSDGNYTVAVKAYDAAGNQASDSVSVTFTNTYVPADLNFTMIDIADDFNPSDALTQTVAVNAPTLKWTDWAAGADEYAVSVWNTSETECYYWVVYGDISSIQYGDKTGASIDWVTNSSATLNDGTYIVNVLGLNGGVDAAIAHLKASVITSAAKSSSTSKAMPFITKEQYNQILLDYKNR